MPRKVKNLSTASLIVESTVALTVPDLVLLALLAERNMHGYDIVQELERREVKDWAEMSRPHVYYSLRKLSNAAFISLESQASLLNMRGPTPQIYALTQQGKQAMRAALARPAWAQQRPPPPFRTWWMLAQHAPAKVRSDQIKRRREYLMKEIKRERDTMEELKHFTEPAAVPGRQIIDLAIRLFEAELGWLEDMN